MDSPTNTVSIVEDFYGTSLSSELIRVIRQTPYDQLLELSDRLIRYNRTLERKLGGLWAGVDRTRSKGGSRGRIYLWEDLYFGSQEISSVCEAPSMKHAILYTDRFIIPDFSLDWAEELAFYDSNSDVIGLSSDHYETQGRILARSLMGLLPIAPLIRAGIAIPAASPQNFDVDENAFLLDIDPGAYIQRYSLSFRCSVNDTDNHDVFWQDPYLAWMIINKMLKVKEWELRAAGLDRREDLTEAASYFLEREEGDPHLNDRFSKLISSLYGPHMTRTVSNALMLNHAYSVGGFAPLASSGIARTHLSRSSMVAVDGLQARGLM